MRTSPNKTKAYFKEVATPFSDVTKELGVML